MKFKENDIIQGIEGSHEEDDICNEFAKMVCLSDEDEDEEVKVRVISHEIDPDYVGYEEYVNVENYELVEVKERGTSFAASPISRTSSFNGATSASVKVLKAKGLI